MPVTVIGTGISGSSQPDRVTVTYSRPSTMPSATVGISKVAVVAPAGKLRPGQMFSHSGSGGSGIHPDHW